MTSDDDLARCVQSDEVVGGVPCWHYVSDICIYIIPFAGSSSSLTSAGLPSQVSFVEQLWSSLSVEQSQPLQRTIPSRPGFNLDSSSPFTAIMVFEKYARAMPYRDAARNPD